MSYPAAVAPPAAPGPSLPMAGAMPPVPAGPPPFSEKKIAAWSSRITAALDGTKDALADGKVNVSRYKAEYFDRTSNKDRIAVPTDFYYVEQKKSQWFYRLPEIFLKPEKPGLEDAAVVFQAAINKKIGPAGLNVLPRIQQVLFDLLMVEFGALKIGYGTAQGDQPIPFQLAPDQPPVQAPNLVASWYFIEHVSPGDLGVPADFVGLDFDEADFLFARFREDVSDDDSGGSDRQDDERRLTPLSSAAQTGRRRYKTGYEVWYRACRFDVDIKHPDKIRCFKLYDDDRRTAVELKDSPYQTTTPAGKLLTGMQGYPIVPVTIRYVSDAWLAPSDASMARAQADELSKCRTQQLEFKNRSMPQVGFDSTRVTKDIQGKIEENISGAWVGFDGPGQDTTWAIEKGRMPREAWTFNDYIQGDLDRIWGLGSNQLGQLDAKNRTATEQQIAQSASQGRLESERETLLHWYAHKVIPKFAALLQLFATEPEFVELIGADAQRLEHIPDEVKQRAQQTGQDARVLVPWNKDAIQGVFSFSAKPNSQLHIDAAQYRKELMDLFNFFANEPTVNKAELVRQIIQAHGFDPAKMIQQPPPKEPVPPKIALSITAAADLNPMAPQYQNVKAICEQEGMKGLVPPSVDPMTANMLQTLSKGPASETQHGGAAALAEKINQHPLDQTGGMQGSGQPAPIAPGGQMGR